MDLEQAIEVLRLHNKWRRGSDDKISPEAIGIAIDTVVKHYSGQKSDLGNWEKKYEEWFFSNEKYFPTPKEQIVYIKEHIIPNHPKKNKT